MSHKTPCFKARTGTVLPSQFDHLTIGYFRTVDGYAHERAFALPALHSGSTGIDVQQIERAVVLHLEYVRVAADEELRRTGVYLRPILGS